jgi:hypothetical protein
MSAATTKTLTMIVTPTAGRPGRYDARLSDGSVVGDPSKQPFVDMARRLFALGYDPTTVLVMRHAGSDIDALTGRIGAAAKLRVKEGKGRPRFVAWDPPRRVEALASARAERVTRVADPPTSEPHVRPGAEARTFSASAGKVPTAPFKQQTVGAVSDRQRHQRERKGNAVTNRNPGTSKIKNEASG